MYIEVGRRIQRIKFELVIKYIHSLPKPEQKEDTDTVDYEEIAKLFAQNNIPVPDSTDPDPEIIMILFYLTNHYTKQSPLLKIMGTTNEGIVFVKN
jgi:hypothetical protein